MPTIKLNASGLVVMQDGKPSCTCCGGCSCAESLEDTYEVNFDYAAGAVPSETVTRDSPCVWLGEWNQTPFGMQPLELRCEGDGWFLRLYSTGGSILYDNLKDDPGTASPVGTYENLMSVS